MKTKVPATVFTILFGFAFAQSAVAVEGAGKTAPSKKSKTVQSSETASDELITYRIRQSIVNDVTLSPEAHNVKVETVKGAVTLKGPVKNVGEKSVVIMLANAIAGEKNVKSQLEVAK